MLAHSDIEYAFLANPAPPEEPPAFRWRIWIVGSSAALLLCILGSALVIFPEPGRKEISEAAEFQVGVVAADDWRCSEIGAAALRAGGHAVDAAAAAMICTGFVHPMSSGIGGGAFIIVHQAGSPSADSFDSRETAPMAASPGMYESESWRKRKGGLSMGIPGELAGLHAAWSKYGRLAWKDLFRPTIELARGGIPLPLYLSQVLLKCEEGIMADPGLRHVFAPSGRLLRTNETYRNPKLADSLELISVRGPRALYDGSIGENLIRDVRSAGAIATVDDLRTYAVRVNQALASNVLGYTLLGMPPPSSGTLGLSMILNIMSGYKSVEEEGRSFVSLHRLIEAIKHMFAIRTNLGDPDFVNVTDYASTMLSPSFADEIRQKIDDTTTFPPDSYLAQWSQPRESGTSHICAVDAERNAVAITSTINDYFGAGILSMSTGIIVNNEMDDFSAPCDASPDSLPPSPANFIQPRKRPLSSMTPLIILKDGQLAGVLGASGGSHIVPAVAQVFLNHFLFGLDPLEAVQRPRVFHKLIPNVVMYENWTINDGESIQLSSKAQEFLKQRGHQLKSLSGGSVVQFVVHNLQEPIPGVVKRNNRKFIGKLIAISDPRKDGQPAGV